MPSSSQMRYPGTEIWPEVGDIVRFLNDPDTLTVEDVVDGPARMKHWGLHEQGVMLTGARYGLVFTRIDDPELEFVAREKVGDVPHGPRPADT